MKACGALMVGSGTDTYDPNCTLAEGHAGPHGSPLAIDQHKVPPGRVKLWHCPACGQRVDGAYTIDERRKRCAKTIHLAKAIESLYRREP